MMVKVRICIRNIPVIINCDQEDVPFVMLQSVRILLAFDLSGHRSEMTGFYFTESRFLYAADAAADERVLTQELVPSEKLLSQQSYPDEYLVSLMALRRLHREHPEITIRFLHSGDIPCFTAE